MSDDHYVARTYLKHFANPSGLLRAYRKSDGKSFPCRPADVCFEPDGDLIPDFLSDPRYLGAFRAAFEPGWNSAIGALKAHRVDMTDKLQLAGYWAQLLVCTPGWRRVAVQISNHNARHTLEAQAALRERIGKPDRLLSEGVEALRDGTITLETEPDFVRAQSATSVMKYAWALYHADMDVFETDDSHPFLTSDNPAAFEDQGDIVGGHPPFRRYLPVTPNLCLSVDLTEYPDRYLKGPGDFTQEPKGTVRGGAIIPEFVDRINQTVARCAEDLVFTSGESELVRDLVAQNSEFRVECESTRFPHGTGFIIANRTRVIKRQTGGKG